MWIRRRWLLGAALLGLVGCGSSTSTGGSGSTSGTPTGVPASSAVSGFVLSTSTRATTVVLSATAASGTAVVGATVDILDRSGNVLATTATGADGSFTLTNIPFAGTTTLSVTPVGGATVTFAVTLVHDRTVAAGTVYPIARAQAIADLQAMAPSGALIALTQNPLPPNTEVHPTFGDVNSALLPDTSAHLTVNAEWLGLIDASSNAPFSHPVQFVYIDAQTGIVAHDDNQPWLPSVNFVPMWDYERDLIRATGPLPSSSAFLTQSNPVPAGAVVASPDLVQAPAPPPPGLPTSRVASARQSSNSADLFGVIWIGVPEVWFVVDENRVLSWMLGMGIPRSNIYGTLDSTSDTDPIVIPKSATTALLPGTGVVRTRATRQANSGFLAANAAIQARKLAGGTPTLYVWAESHGNRVGQVRELDLSEGIGTTAYNLALKIGSFFSSNLKNVTPPPITALPLVYIDDVLPLQTTTACYVRAYIATCYSYNHLARWRANFLNTMQDVVLYSSSGDVPTYGNGFISQFGNYFSGDETHFSELGMNFTRQVTSNMPPTFTPYATPPASTGPQTWVRPSTCEVISTTSDTGSTGDRR